MKRKVESETSILSQPHQTSQLPESLKEEQSIATRTRSKAKNSDIGEKKSPSKLKKKKRKTETKSSSEHIEKKMETTPEEVSWQWRNDRRTGWNPYDSQTNAEIEKAYSQGKSSVVLKNGYFGKTGGYTLNFGAMTQMKNVTGFTRSIRRVCENPSKDSLDSSADPKWEWKYKDKWKEFERRANSLLEGSLSRGQAKAMLSPEIISKEFKGGFEVDFRNLQLCGKLNGESFPIRRVPSLAGHSIYGNPKTQKVQTKSLAEEKKVSSSTSRKVAKVTKWKVLKDLPEENCPICLDSLKDDDQRVVHLSKCGTHYFHQDCIMHCFRDNFLQCPICSQVYGVRVGTQPPGEMLVERDSASVRGHEEYGTIIIEYSFNHGTQGPNHPNPGKPYHGTIRTAFLPDSPEGNRALKLLQVAWERKLVFTVGTSVTTGHSDVVIWNGIHHKTDISGGPTNYGYPDRKSVV